MNHTPGEWTIRYDSHGAAIKGPRGESVAWCGDNYSTDTESVPFRANARLIAAAPDLLKALVDLLNLPSQCECAMTEEEEALWDRALEAVRKARGEE